MKAPTKAEHIFKKIENEPFAVLRILRDKLNLEMELRQTYPNYKAAKGTTT